MYGYILAYVQPYSLIVFPSSYQPGTKSLSWTRIHTICDNAVLLVARGETSAAVAHHMFYSICKSTHRDSGSVVELRCFGFNFELTLGKAITICESAHRDSGSVVKLRCFGFNFEFTLGMAITL